MKYQFNHSKVPPLYDELILISCKQRSNQGDGNFHQKHRMGRQSNCRRLVTSCLWGQDFSSCKI